MGNGHGLGAGRDRPESELLTPHGERSPAPALLAAYGAVLLTPHGERSPAPGRASRGGASPPNPSWGTVTLLLPCIGLVPCPPNPSWGTVTGADALEVPGGLDLLTPHGERSHRHARSADLDLVLLTPHGERSRAGQAGPRLRGRLLTPHGERSPPVRAARRGEHVPLLTPHGERSRALPRRHRRYGADLLTPHGERSPGALLDSLLSDTLLTPHGERSLGRGHRCRQSKHSPNPSWGTVTLSHRR